MGTVLHFHMTMLEDYYILNPQWWFDACALVVSPNNVSTLVTAGGGMCVCGGGGGIRPCNYLCLYVSNNGNQTM